MNVLSLAHYNAQKQESWSDDPFDLKKVTGVARMSNEQQLHSYVQELVVHYARIEDSVYELCLSELSSDAQNELVRLYIECTGRETNECIYGKDFSIENDFNCALLSMLQNNCEETRNHFAETTQKNIISYYAQSLQNLLDKACCEHLTNVYLNTNHYAHADRDTGEVVWRRSL